MLPTFQHGVCHTSIFPHTHPSIGVSYTYVALLLGPYKAQKTRRKFVVTLKSVTLQATVQALAKWGKL